MDWKHDCAQQNGHSLPPVGSLPESVRTFSAPPARCQFVRRRRRIHVEREVRESRIGCSGCVAAVARGWLLRNSSHENNAQSLYAAAMGSKGRQIRRPRSLTHTAAPARSEARKYTCLGGHLRKQLQDFAVVCVGLRCRGGRLQSARTRHRHTAGAFMLVLVAAVVFKLLPTENGTAAACRY